MISAGQKCGMACIPMMMAVSLPTWLDWSFPGTLTTLFLGSSGLNQIPLLHLASSFPFLKQAPSMYMVTLSWRALTWSFVGRWAGTLVILWGSVKIRKHSVVSSLAVIEGSNGSEPLSAFARLF